MVPKITTLVLDKLRPGWRERAAKRKSPWNLACGLIALGFAALFWYFLFQVAWELHTHFYPEHLAHKNKFWGQNISFCAGASSFLMVMPLFIPAFALGGLCSNCLMWCIPAARRTMEAEAAGDQEMTFMGANAGLIKWGGIASAVCLMLSIIGILTLHSLK